MIVKLGKYVWCFSKKEKNEVAERSTQKENYFGSAPSCKESKHYKLFSKSP